MQTNSINYNKLSNYALLGLRIVLVLIFLYHGVPKAIFWTAASEKFIGFGLPGFLGPITGVAEVIASVLLLFGRFWKTTNLILIFIIAGAIATVQIPKIVADPAKLANLDIAGLERDLLILFGHITLLAFPPRQRAGVKQSFAYQERSKVKQ